MEYTYGFPTMVDIIPATEPPEGDGFWIKHYEITDEEVQRQRYRLDWTMRGLEPGLYCVLSERRNTRDHPWMSDTWLERYTNVAALEASRGDVLILGLGIGLLPVACCRKEEVSSVTVVEIEPQVIALVEPHISHPKLRVIQGDAFAPPFRGKVFDTVYVDIWRDICSDNWEPMKGLLRQYRKLACPGAYVSAWMKDYVQSAARENARRWY